LRRDTVSVEIHDKLIALLGEVGELRTKEAALKADKTRHLEQIAASEADVRRCEEELGDIRENQLKLRREMDGLRDALFAREEELVATDEPRTTEGDEGLSPASAAKKAWDERAKHLKQVR
jgi:chromosome segregation ATPase